jgi:hypothetical protein
MAPRRDGERRPSPSPRSTSASLARQGSANTNAVGEP